MSVDGLALAVVQQSHLLAVTVGVALVFSPVLVFLVFGPPRKTTEPPPPTLVTPREPAKEDARRVDFPKVEEEEPDEMLLSELPPMVEEPEGLREAPSEVRAKSPPPRMVRVPREPREIEVPETASAPTAPPKLPSSGFGSCSMSESQGGRKHMEDTHFATSLDDDVMIAGVFDGCGGGRASKLARDTIVKSSQNSLVAAIAEAEKTVLAASRREGNWPDACAVVLAKVRNATLDVAWCGDSRALLGTMKGPVALTRDHNAGDALEEKRVKQAGGKVARSAAEAKAGSAKKMFGKVVGSAVAFQTHSKNPKRVFPGGITLTRCVGALPLKYAKPQLVLATPETATRHLDGTELFVLLASDGIFEALSDAKVSDTVLAAFNAKKDPSKALIAAATAAGSTDNVTALVVNLRHDAPSSS